MRARTIIATLCTLAVALGLTLGAPRAAHAFCGFYVSGADASLYNNATMVVMMREGTRTVLSMQNNYQGPPRDFAMVVPVPVVLHRENVKTLPRDIFQRVDQLAAPRLVEYWEQDPCYVERSVRYRRAPMAPTTQTAAPARAGGRGDLGVRIEAQFVVGEYEIVVLSARDSNGLDTWLRREHYNIPQGAEPVLRPYVQAGTKFFVARVDASKVTFRNGQAQLSPLRFHYDTDDFTLPVRLGLLNSAGTQDLLVHILARGQRYEVANYPNVTIPTNLRVTNAVRQRFGPFYAAVLDKTLERNPRSVVTEYAWDAGTCDPCPTEPLNPSELSTLGADVLVPNAAPPQRRGGRAQPMPPRPPWMGGYGGGFVLTRLHYRYTRDTLGQDLVFRAAVPILGGRGIPDQSGRLEQGVQQQAGINNFQGRYVILHWWPREIACDRPQRGRWGGPPNGREPRPVPALDLAFVQRRGIRLDQLIRQRVPELGIGTGGGGGARQPGPSKAPPRTRRGAQSGALERRTPARAGLASALPDVGLALLGMGPIAAVWVVWKKRKRA